MPNDVRCGVAETTVNRRPMWQNVSEQEGEEIVSNTVRSPARATPLFGDRLYPLDQPQLDQALKLPGWLVMQGVLYLRVPGAAEGHGMQHLDLDVSERFPSQRQLTFK
jgi:hypothetical protein